MITTSSLAGRIVLRHRGFCNALPRYVLKRLFAAAATSHNNTLIYNLNDYKSSFPKDFVINDDITEFIRLTKHKLEPQSIKIGVIYENDQARSSSKIIESLLADPLASGSEVWLDEISTREGNGQYKYSQEVVIDRANQQFGVPSPILSASLRNTFAANIESPTDLVIEEVEDVAEVTEYVFLINVSNQLGNLDYPPTTRNKILLNVIDNQEFTPLSSESTPVSFKNEASSHIIKINSQLAFTGIDQIIKNGVASSDVFIDNMTKSNIYELFKAINWFSQTPVLGAWLLHNIKLNIERKIELTASPEETNEISNIEISRFIDLVNKELQDDFEPKTVRFFHKNLSWWKLYYKNDNIEYEIKDFFLNNFMNKSIESYNYLRGKINPSDSDISVANPLFALKQEVINKSIAEEVQPKVYRALGEGFLYYQLPISLLSFFGFQYLGYAANDCIALAILGLVLGFNQVSKVWTGCTDKWLTNLFEEIRVCLGKQCVEEGLLKESNAQLTNDIKSTKLRQDIFNEINK
ncbi:hypothetical protein Cantr_03446 [Candida viswanathii]|uniref:Mmc1 C-terminal domain-containing protein n=1 Tax=Candida viswanathii TaxID=5486 RepID=A0A367YML6_9ASCO|nr:hypothetical protein Cantr_03446 [Candida viswanathii]